MTLQIIHSYQKDMLQITSDKGSDDDSLLVFDGALSDGLLTRTPSNITFDGVYIKIKYDVQHGYIKKQYIDINGTIDSNFKKCRIVKLDEYTVWVDRKNISDLSGSNISTNISSLGWENIFADINHPTRRAYRSKNVTSNKDVIVMDVSRKNSFYSSTRPSKFIKLDMCADMIDIDTMISSYSHEHNKETDTNKDGRFSWYMSREHYIRNKVSDVYNVPWIIVGDDRLFYFIVGGNNYTDVRRKCKVVYGFGEIPRLSQNDIHNTVLFCENDNKESSASYCNGYNGGILATMLNPNVSVGKYSKSMNGNILLAKVYARSQANSNNPSGKYPNETPNPLNYGLVYGDIMLSRYEHGKDYYSGNLPYVKSILCDISGDISYDMTYNNNHFIFLASYESTSTQKYLYLAINLDEIRQDDNV